MEVEEEVEVVEEEEKEEEVEKEEVILGCYAMVLSHNAHSSSCSPEV